MGTPIEASNMKKKGIQIKLKIHFTIKNEVQIASSLGQIFAALAVREFSLAHGLLA